MKVVLANSVGVDKDGYHIIHSPSRWSVGVRSGEDWFAYYPWELAYASSLLKRDAGHEVKFLDGCLNRYDHERYFEVLAGERPEWLVMESSSRTMEEDLRLALRAKKELGAKLVFAGQHPSAFPEDVLARGVDHVLTGEYEYALLDLIRGVDPSGIPGLYPNRPRPLLNPDDLPFPEDEDVSRYDYSVPGEPNCEYREIQMYSSRGCRMSCGFCVARNLYYGRPNWRPRAVEDVVEEIRLMSEKYPAMQGVFFDEEDHNSDRGFILRLTKAIRDAGLHNLKYDAMCGYWTLDAETLEAMAGAGYYKIRVGIETASEKVAKAMNKGVINVPKVVDALKAAKRAGLRTYGTFTIGAYGSDRTEDMKTVALIERLLGEGLLDGSQISINTPQPGTPFYNMAKESGLLVTEDWRLYDGGSKAVVSYPDYPAGEIEEVFRLACSARDHAVFSKKLADPYEVARWSGRALASYGLAGTIKKGVRRVIKELSYRVGRR